MNYIVEELPDTSSENISQFRPNLHKKRPKLSQSLDFWVYPFPMSEKLADFLFPKILDALNFMRKHYENIRM